MQIKDVPNTFDRFLRIIDWDVEGEEYSEEGKEYSEEVATNLARVSCHVVFKYMIRIASVLGNATPSEELAQHKEVVKKHLQKFELLLLSHSH